MIDQLRELLGQQHDWDDRDHEEQRVTSDDGNDIPLARGSLAAHASLVAREYGIPAVVGAGIATLRLRDGQVVTVDGGIGTVELAR